MWPSSGLDLNPGDKRCFFKDTAASMKRGSLIETEY